MSLTPVLSGSGAVVRNGCHVQLGQRVVDVKVILVVVGDDGSNLGGVAQERLVLVRSVHSHRHVATAGIDLRPTNCTVSRFRLRFRPNFYYSFTVSM